MLGLSRKSSWRTQAAATPRREWREVELNRRGWGPLGGRGGWWERWKRGCRGTACLRGRDRHQGRGNQQGEAEAVPGEGEGIGADCFFEGKEGEVQVAVQTASLRGRQRIRQQRSKLLKKI